MAVRDNQPLQGGFATVVALTLISAAPVLAAPDRNICDDAAEPTLEVSTTELSTAAPEDANESVKLQVNIVNFYFGKKNIEQQKNIGYD